MNQPGLILGSQDTGGGATVSYIQPTTIIATGERVVRSCPLIGFGVVLFLLCLPSVGLSAWLVKLTNFEPFADASLVCGAIFFIISILSMHGGNDVTRRQYCIIWVMVLSIVGLIVAVVAVIVNLVALAKFLEECVDCYDNDDTLVGEIKTIICPAECYLPSHVIAYGPVHVVLAVLGVLEGVAALILSISACCTACSCCCCYEQYHPQGYVLQSPVGATQYTIGSSSNVPYRPLSSSLEC